MLSSLPSCLWLLIMVVKFRTPTLSLKLFVTVILILKHSFVCVCASIFCSYLQKKY